MLGERARIAHGVDDDSCQWTRIRYERKVVFSRALECVAFCRRRYGAHTSRSGSRVYGREPENQMRGNELIYRRQDRIYKENQS